MRTHTGRCLCGAVQFSATSEETHYHACHCGMCRRWSGGPMLAAPVADVSFSGAEHLTRYASSEWAERGFCRTCGSSLFYYLIPADRYFITVGTFDEASMFALNREIFIDHKPGDYNFAGEHERLTEAQTLAQFSSGSSDA